MGVDKQLEIVYDLASLNEQQAGELIAANEQVIKSAESQKKKTKKKAKKTEEKKGDTQKKKKDEQKKQKELEKKQDNKFKDFIKNNSKNLSGFVFSTLRGSIPQLTAILAVTGIITSIIKRINEIQSKFTENVDERINAGISNAEQARIDANLQQVIITNGDGSVNPRNVYNSLNESDANVSVSESNFRLDDTSGYE